MADETHEPTDADGSATPSTTPDTTDVTDATPAAATGQAGGTTGKTTGDKTSGDTATGDGPKKVVAKKKVVSKRVTPKGGATVGSTPAHAHAPEGDDAAGSKRYTPPTAKYAQGPSPTWVPVLMFALFGFGVLFIVVNYAGLFGDPENWRLLVGLAAILGGIIAATNYR